MRFVGGHDLAMVEATSRALREVGQEASRLEASDLEPARLFSRLHADRPEALVLIDALPRLDQVRTSATLDLGALVRVIGAAGVEQLIVVTGRPAVDPALLEVRRSGVPYGIVQVPAVLDIATETMSHLLTVGKVIVTPELVERTRGAVLATDVATVIAAALADDRAGWTWEVMAADGDRVLLSFLERLNVRVGSGRLRSSMWRTMGRPELCIGTSGLLEVAAPRRARARTATTELPFELERGL